ncbi:RNA recognition domain-containing protein [Plectosphaerella plurivora]|uniref:RNA recognition domain-containing protein n=1 Tax=Plectosphaerella plurivora TaxID=936078 RepID=A0A9P8VIW2_9PEZI|nr:RNA recognition domain-containing protein [Plectosphaerella plurivora]
MLFPEEDAPHVRAWLMKKLPEVSETETDILADYVFALFNTYDTVSDEVEAYIKHELLDALEPEKIPPFVDEVLRVIQHKSYLPGAPPPPKNPPAGQQDGQGRLRYEDSNHYEQREWNGNKKRSHRDAVGDDDVDMQGRPGDGRAFKQPRGGAHSSRRGAASPPPNAPTGPSNGFAQGFDPMAASFQPSFGGSFDGPQFPASEASRPYGAPQGPASGRKPCRDFQTKGYCARGNACKFSHGTQPISMPQSGFNIGGNDIPEGQFRDMMQIMMTQTSQQMADLMEAFKQVRGGGQAGRGGRGGSTGSRRKRKASISADGPVHDKSRTSIVVENIPKDHQNEEEVREAFASFGNITEVTLQPKKRLAIVKYDTWESANAAYRSPKVIFDNRFVRVFWQQDEADMIDADKEPEIDLEEFMKKQDEAQKKYDENLQKKAEIDRQREELEQKQRDLLARQREVREKLRAKLNNGEGASTGSTSTSDALRAQLAALEEEAFLLGLDPDADDVSVYSGEYRGRGRGRGRGRARGAWAPRARGSYRGRGGGPGRGDIHAAYATYSLDNRPRVVSVAGADFSSPARDEALRQHLLGIGEFTGIETTPTGAQITFKDRKTAEKFFYGVSLGQGAIPGVEEKLELGWVAKAQVPAPAPAAASNHVTKTEPDDDMSMANIPNAPSPRHDVKFDMDYEQAEEGEWGIE